MRKPVRWIVVFLIIAAAAVLIWWKMQPKPVEVTVQAVTKGIVEKTVANTRAGTVNACRRAKLSPSIGGQIARLPVQEGDQVKSGELLLEIWNDDIKAQLSQAQNEVAVSEAQEDAACLSADEAQRSAKRVEALFAKKVSTEEQADQARTRARSLQAQCEAARKTVVLKESIVSVWKANIARTRLIAPFAGIVAKIEGELNEYVTPSPVGVVTPPVIDLIENNCFYVSAPIDEVDAALVRVGMEVRISLDAFRGRDFAGKVTRIAPYVMDYEKQARTVEIETAFSKEEELSSLLAGYSADVEIIIATRADTVKIPTEALIDNSAVYVYSENEAKAQLVTVEPGLSNWQFTEIVSGLEAGQLIIMNIDNPDLKDGGIVAVKKGEP